MNKKENNNKNENPLKFYAKYSSLALQMIVIILAGAFGGRALDNRNEAEFPVFTVTLTTVNHRQNRSMGCLPHITMMYSVT